MVVALVSVGVYVLASHVDGDRLDLTVADLGHHGPGVIIEHDLGVGVRVLVWVE